MVNKEKKLVIGSEEWLEQEWKKKPQAGPGRLPSPAKDKKPAKGDVASGRETHSVGKQGRE